jgi:cobalt-zinc-cadmium efflux system outer membrane protein
MSRSLRAALFGALTVLPSSLAADSPLPSRPAAAFDGATLFAYVDRARAANPDLRASARRLEAARHRVPQAGRPPEPQVQLLQFVESVQTRTGPQERVLGLTQSLPWFGTLGRRRDAAAAEALSLRHAYRDEQLALVRAVAGAYFEYAYLGEATRLTQRSVDLLSALEPVVEQRVAAGGNLNALLRLKVEVGMVGDRLRSLEPRRAAASARLVRLLALDPETVLPWPTWPEPDSAAVPTTASLDSALRVSPAIRALDQQIAAAGQRQRAARLRSRPDLSVGINYIQVGDPAVGPAGPDGGVDPWGIAVGVTLPVWRGADAAAADEARLLQRVAEDQRRARLHDLQAQVRSSRAAWLDARRRLGLYGDELLGLARQAMANSRAGYEGDRVGILEVIDSERSLLDLQLRYWRAVADAWQERVRLESLTDRPILGTYHVRDDQ